MVPVLDPSSERGLDGVPDALGLRPGLQTVEEEAGASRFRMRDRISSLNV